MKQSSIRQSELIKAYIPMYEPLEVVKCEKCGEVIAEPKEMIRFQKPSERVEKS